MSEIPGLNQHHSSSDLFTALSVEAHPRNEALISSGSCNQYIKRPLNAYMIWTKEARRQIVAADPKLRMNEVSKALGQIWSKMSDQEKKPYFDMAEKSATEHKQALQNHPELTYAPSKARKKRATAPLSIGKHTVVVHQQSVGLPAGSNVNATTSMAPPPSSVPNTYWLQA